MSDWTELQTPCDGWKRAESLFTFCFVLARRHRGGLLVGQEKELGESRQM